MILKMARTELISSLVFKLSRFAEMRRCAQLSLQLMQDYGVNLICVEDGD